MTYGTPYPPPPPPMTYAYPYPPPPPPDIYSYPTYADPLPPPPPPVAYAPVTYACPPPPPPPPSTYYADAPVTYACPPPPPPPPSTYYADAPVTYAYPPSPPPYSAPTGMGTGSSYAPFPPYFAGYGVPPSPPPYSAPTGMGDGSYGTYAYPPAPPTMTGVPPSPSPYYAPTGMGDGSSYPPAPPTGGSYYYPPSPSPYTYPPYPMSTSGYPPVPPYYTPTGMGDGSSGYPPVPPTMTAPPYPASYASGAPPMPSYACPPLPFADDGSSITLTFDERPTNRAGVGGGAFACSSVLAAATATMAGGGTCTWSSASTLVVSLTDTATAAVGASVEVAPGVVCNVVFPSACASGAVALEAAASPQIPVAAIAGSLTPSVCDPVSLSALPSTGGGVLPRTYEWSVGDQLYVAEPQNGQIRALFASGEMEVVIPGEQPGSASLLPPGVKMTITLVVRTAIGGVSVPLTVEVIKSAAPLLQVTAVGGVAQRSLLSGSDAVLRASVAVPPMGCIDSAAVTQTLALTWTLVETTSSRARRRLLGREEAAEVEEAEEQAEQQEEEDAEGGKVGARRRRMQTALPSAAGQKLGLPAGTLAPGGDYVATFRAEAPGSDLVGAGELSIALAVGHSALVVGIVGGAEVSMGRASTYVLDAAAASSDPDAVYSGLATLASYEWSCVDLTADAGCGSLTLSGADAAAGRLSLGPFSSFSTVLQPGARLQLTVVARQGVGTANERSGTASQVVAVVAGQPPLVALSVPAIVKAADEVRIIGTATSAESGGGCTALYAAGTEPIAGTCTASFAYAVVETAGGASLAASAVTSKPGRPVLVLGGDSLVAGASYSVTLRAVDAATGGEGLAAATVYVTQPPYAGSLVLKLASDGSVVSGEVTMTTAVRMELPTAADPEGELPMTFAFRATTALGLTQLRGAQEDAWHECTLPPGQITVRGVVIDAHGAEGNADAAVSVVAAASSEQRAAFSAQISTAQQTQDVEAVWSTVFAHAIAVASAATTDDDLVATLQGMTPALAQAVPPADATADEVRMFVQAVGSTVSLDTSWQLLPQADVATSVAMLADIVASGGGGRDSVDALGPETLTALGNLLDAFSLAESSPPSPPPPSVPTESGSGITIVTGRRRLSDAEVRWRRLSEGDANAATVEAGRELFNTTAGVARQLLSTMVAGDPSKSLASDALQIAAYKDYSSGLLLCGADADADEAGECCFDVRTINADPTVQNASSRACLPPGSYAVAGGEVVSIFGVVYLASPLGYAQLDDYNSSADLTARYKAPRYTTAIMHQVLSTTVADLTATNGTNGTKALYWLSKLATDRLFASDDKTGRTPFRCNSNALCRGRQWANVAGECIEVTGQCVCPLPWGGASCARELTCRWFDLGQEQWRADGCALSLGRSNDTHVVCECETPRELVGCMEKEPVRPAAGVTPSVNAPAFGSLDLDVLFDPDELLPLTLIVVFMLGFWGSMLLLAKLKGNEAQLRRERQKFHFWRQRHKEQQALKKKPFFKQSWLHIKTQHKLLRVFTLKYELGQDPKAAPTGAQKVTVLVSILMMKMLVTALVYRGGCDIDCLFAGDVVVQLTPTTCSDLNGEKLTDVTGGGGGGGGDQGFVVSDRRRLYYTPRGWEWPGWEKFGWQMFVATIIAIGMQPATVWLDFFIFRKAQRVTNAHDDVADGVEDVQGKHLMTRAAMQSALNEIDVSVAWLEWKTAVAEMKVQFATARLRETRMNRLSSSRSVGHSLTYSGGGAAAPAAAPSAAAPSAADFAAALGGAAGCRCSSKMRISETSEDAPAAPSEASPGMTYRDRVGLKVPDSLLPPAAPDAQGVAFTLEDSPGAVPTPPPSPPEGALAAAPAGPPAAAQPVGARPALHESFRDGCAIELAWIHWKHTYEGLKSGDIVALEPPGDAAPAASPAAASGGGEASSYEAVVARSRAKRQSVCAAVHAGAELDAAHCDGAAAVVHALPSKQKKGTFMSRSSKRSVRPSSIDGQDGWTSAKGKMRLSNFGSVRSSARIAPLSGEGKIAEGNRKTVFGADGGGKKTVCGRFCYAFNRSYLFWKIYPWVFSCVLNFGCAFLTLAIGAQAFEGCPDLIVAWWVTFTVGMLQSWFIWDIIVIVVRNNAKCTKKIVATKKYQTIEKLVLAPIRVLGKAMFS